MKPWIKWLLLGLLSLVFGVFVLANPIAATFAVTTVAGILFIVVGGFQFIAGFGADGIGGKLLGIALGVLMVFLGGSLLYHPLQGVISLTLLVTILFAANGLTRLISSFQMRDTPYFWPMLLSGALSLLLAGYITANFFELAPSLLGLLLGIEMLFNGVGLLMLAFFIRNNGDKIDELRENLKM